MKLIAQPLSRKRDRLFAILKPCDGPAISLFLFHLFSCKVWRGVRLGPDGEPMTTEGYVLKRMLLEKGKHVMQAGIRYGSNMLYRRPVFWRTFRPLLA